MERRITILGLGFAGSLAAYRLANAGWNVTVIDPHAARRLQEREDGKGRFDATHGIAQSGHVHVLLGRGLALLREVYPGFERTLDDAGCPTLDWAADTVWRAPFGLAPTYASGVRTRSMSRACLDAFLLEQALRHPRVTLLTGFAKSLLLGKKGVRGVLLAAGETHAAHRIVDARGALSTVRADLRMGEEGHGQRRVNVGLCYRTVILEGVPLARQHYEQPLARASLDGAVLTPIEQGRAILTTIHFPGSTLASRPFADTLEALKDGAFLAALRSAGSVSPVRRYVFAQCLWQRFGSLPLWPAGLAVLGDASYRLNPVFGQGMTVTALCVEELIRCLERDGDRSAFAEFQKAADGLVAMPWALSSQSPLSVKGRLVDLAVRLAFSSPRLHRRFLLAQHMLGFPTHAKGTP